MPTQLYLLADTSLPAEALDACRDYAGLISTAANVPLLLAYVDPDTLNDLMTRIQELSGQNIDDELGESKIVATSEAPLVYGKDGKVDWASMWADFPDLALYGGRPERSEATAITIDGAFPDSEPGIDAVAEIRRGIWETTKLFAEPEDDGWLAISCPSRKMAAWLCAATILENVDARCDEDRLLVPARPTFRLEDEVRGVITAVAKTHHYWTSHVQSPAAIGSA